MVDVYTDRDSMFTTAPRSAENQAERITADRLTQIGRGLRELGIGWIAAYSPQAKGRIERSFSTAQDRLVKQRRLVKISTLEAANAFLEKEYWPEWNTRFARRVEDFPITIAPWASIWIWPQSYVTSNSVSSATTTRFPSRADATRLLARRRKRACAANEYAWNSASTAS